MAVVSPGDQANSVYVFLCVLLTRASLPQGFS